MKKVGYKKIVKEIANGTHKNDYAHKAKTQAELIFSFLLPQSGPWNR
jgi:hypothetical protein